MRSPLVHSVAAACLALGSLMSSACGASPSPATPSVRPTAPEVAGAWLGEQTVTLFAGGEEFASIFEESKGLPSQFAGTLAQSGGIVSGTLDLGHTGAVCSYTGTIEGDSLNLTADGCTGPRIVGIEFPDRVRRDLVPESMSLVAKISGDRIEGFAIEHDSVVESGTARNVGTLSIENAFTMTRR